jgi:ABC-2 type transport system permease protein
VAGIIGASLMSTGFVGLAIGIASERDSGMLKRLAGTPMPKSIYFIGKIGMVVVTVCIQVIVLVVIGVVLFDTTLPDTAVRLVTFGWVLMLGTTAATLLGIAVAGFITDAKAAPAVVNLPFVALQFISGVWIAPTLLPTWLVNVAKVFPLYWMCRGMRSVFLPDDFKVVETGGQWDRLTAALVLTAWCVAAFIVCMRTFKWSKS